MEDNKDKSERLNYFYGEKQKQDKRKNLYVQQLEEIRSLLEVNEKEIKYNGGWISFHETSIESHKKQIQETFDFEKKKEQEERLKFHTEQIENHHKKCIEFHKKEVEFIKKEIQLFEDGIKKCEEQLEFLNKKIEENTKISKQTIE